MRNGRLAKLYCPASTFTNSVFNLYPHKNNYLHMLHCYKHQRDRRNTAKHENKCLICVLVLKNVILYIPRMLFSNQQVTAI